MITSKSNGQLKKIRQLIESSKARKEQGLFVVEGTRIVSEVPENLLESIYVSETYSKENENSIPCGCEFEVVADELFKSLSDTVNPQGILAVVRKPSNGIEKVLGHDLFLILDDVRDPGNMGTMIRTAEAAGAAVIISENSVDIFNPKVTRSTMGSIFRVPIVISGVVEAIKNLQEEGVTVCAAVLDGSVPYKEAAVDGPCAFIVGNEANGVSQEAAQASDLRVRIPMKGRVESLNAAISAAVLLYSRN